MSCADIIVCGLNIATLLVAIVTLFSTKRQFEKNMKEQEKAINISLIDLRTEILTAVKHDNFSFDRTRSDLLFNTEISNLIFVFDCLNNKTSSLERKLNDYHSVIALTRDYSQKEAEQFLIDLAKYESMSPDDPIYEELERKIVGIRLVDDIWEDGDKCERVESPSFVDVRNDYYETKDKVYELKLKIADKMEKFIEDSISTDQKN